MIGKTRKIRLSTYDAKWSKKAREEYPFCEVCDKTEHLAAHHYIGRRVKATRLLIENAVILCPSHHVFNSEFSAHLTPEAFKRWFKEIYPARETFLASQSVLNKTERQAIKEYQELYERE